jgi:molybdate transport system substrate-binding protein
MTDNMGGRPDAKKSSAIVFGVLAMAMMLIVACGSSDDEASNDTDRDGTVTVSAAASLTDVFTEIGGDFTAANPGMDVRFNFGSSSTLAGQIADGAPADAFASADEANMNKLVDAKLVEGDPIVFARNELTIVVPAGNPKNVRTLDDLASVGTVSLCGREVPCGRYADQVLQEANVAIPESSVTRGQDVKATLGAVAEGDADAAIVYVTDVTGDGIEAIAIPDAQNAIATYPIAGLASSSHPEIVRAFVAHVLSPAGQARLTAAGFLPPP